MSVSTLANQAISIAGARSIGNTVGESNHIQRATACWNAMINARNEIEEPKPQNPKSVGKPLPQEFINKLIEIDNIYAKQIWNAAIDAAAKIHMFQDGWISEEIRRLKK